MTGPNPIRKRQEFDNGLYVLESMTAPGFPGPEQFGTGRIVRIEHSGAQRTIASGLTFPTAMTFGPDGALYVSNIGFGVPIPGAGQIVRVEVTD
ncbi:MAG: hypothetical protein DMG08_21930 [Acidobacteria bacterium]|nr:MAG: hypothetical protein DMG08_21930 [Acidobacteriota bacterium]PYV30202.1 MAG: hypothetical protein DMG09_28050 [Acidobacteriota bacterium]